MTLPPLSEIHNVVNVKFAFYGVLMVTLSSVYMYGTATTQCTKAVLSCFVIALTFVGSLYVWKTKHHRDHPSTIKKRCASVFIMSILSPSFVYLFAVDAGSQQPFMHLLGLKWAGTLASIVLPLLLTMVLFSGPLLLRASDGVFWLYLERRYWASNCRNLVWLRNHIVAPFSEEFSFRACMLPLLVNCYSQSATVIICPLFFGVAHAHHLIERVRQQGNFKKAVLETIFQFAYTTVFGAYSAFLFLRTGHFVAPFVVHAFCNHMGFPDFEEVLRYTQPKRIIISFVFIFGAIAWYFLLYPLTNPLLFSNDIYL